MYIEVNQLTAKYGSTIALDNVSLSIEKGEFICFIGPSGCGKTTLMNAVAGFAEVSAGSVTIEGVTVSHPRIEYITIFQNYGLLPWRTVRKNVEFGLEKKKVPREERGRLAGEYIRQVGLEGFEKRYPHQLSGGQQQRVAIARALAVDPEILFMDEPFGALDAITRMKLQDDVLKLSKQQKKTILFVTHDIEEAVFLADRIVVMSPNPGRIKKIIRIPLSRTNRDRTSSDFLYWRDKVFEVFNMKHEPMIDYVI